MPFFIGVDGGGSKTAFALSYANGIPIVQTESIGCSYQSVGLERAADIIADGIKKCSAQAGEPLENCAYCCIGIPCWGENAESDTALYELLKQKLPGVPIKAVNDVEVAWAGAQECRPGIHIVAGTGSITYGVAPDGKTARCGGWNEFFGDEGSCYWIGRKGMELFSKEADGRIRKGPLYNIVRKELHLEDDYSFIDEVVTKISPYRDKVAAFQKYVLAAAEAGDTSAIRLYREASIELALLVKALATQLSFENKSFNVTYSGGLFHAGTFILEPLRAEIAKIDGELCKPKRTAPEGALLMAIASLLSLITLVGMIVGSILFIVGSKIVGKRNCMFGIAIIYTAINIFQYLSGWSSIPVILVCATISNICMGAAIVCVNAMLADTIEYGEWKTGQRNEAMITSTRCFVTKCVSAVSGLVIALVIAVTGMVPQAAEQAPVVLNSFHFIYTLGSAGVMILAVVPMAFYKLTEKRHAEIMAELAARKQKD